MSTRMVRQTMFTSGEVDINNWNRTDVQSYMNAAQSLQNMEVGTTGLAKKRKGTTRLSNVTAKITDTSAQFFQMTDKNNNYYLGIASDLNFSIYSISSTSLTFLQSLVTPYVSSDLSDIDYDLTNDVLVMTHQNYPPARIYVSSYSPLTFAYQVLNIYPYPTYDFGNINYNNFTVNASVAGSTLTFQFTGLASDPGYTTDWIGGQIIGAGASDIAPIGYAIITNVVPYSAGTVTFTATVQVAFAATFSTIGNQYSIRQPAWSSSLGYPGKVLFYQNRLWMASSASLESTIFGSKINNYTNYDVGTGRDSDAIVYTIGTGNPGPILWMNGGKQLEIFTTNYEFACPQQQDSGLTPSTFSIRQQSSFGSAQRCKPLTYSNDTYYINRVGNAIINFHFDGVGLAYTSTNISLQSTHLVKNPLNRALLQGTDTSQDNFVYYLNDDNTVTSFQFSHESQLAALTPCTFEDNIDILDIISIENNIYFLRHYTVTNQFIVEYFDDTVRMDSVIESTMNSSGVISGLADYNGYTVNVLFDEQDYGSGTVSGGNVTVDNAQGYTGDVQVGFVYPVTLTPMYIFGGELETYYAKQIKTIFVDYNQSLNFYVNGILVQYQTYPNVQAGLPPQPQTGTAVVRVTSGYNRFSTFSITQNAPFDLQITGIGYQIKTAIV